MVNDGQARDVIKFACWKNIFKSRLSSEKYGAKLFCVNRTQTKGLANRDSKLNFTNPVLMVRCIYYMHFIKSNFLKITNSKKLYFVLNYSCIIRETAISDRQCGQVIAVRFEIEKSTNS